MAGKASTIGEDGVLRMRASAFACQLVHLDYISDLQSQDQCTDRGQGCGQCGAVFFTLLQEANLEPKEVTYNRIINARTGANDAGKAEQWLTWMQ